MQKAYLEVVRFSESDVIATSTFDGVYFTTLPEWSQFETDAGEYGYSNYVAFEGYGPSNDPDNIYYYDEDDSPLGYRYAWYDTGDSAWHSDNKYAADYWNGSSYTFPTGKN